MWFGPQSVSVLRLSVEQAYLKASPPGKRDSNMDLTVFLVVMFAALLHAGWNALVKSGGDKYFSMTAVVLGHVPLALIALAFVPPPNLASLPYLIAGALLHTAYQLFLLSAYKLGDFTQVYPIARGTAPLLVAVISVTFLGVTLSSGQMLAIGFIAIGIMSLCLVRAGDGQRNLGAAAMALITACSIAGYSLVDGLGARVAGSPIGFYAWETILNALIFAIYILVSRPRLLTQVVRDGGKIAVIGGGASFLAYALIMWCFTQAPIALVTALRETSIVFALLIGVFILREPLSLTKVFSTCTTLCGAALLKFAR
jgi:drug/metabolite transporter (DMT)-like permease